MKAILESNTIWFLRSLFVLVCFFQSSIVAISANTVDSGFNLNNPILETHVQNEIASTVWAEVGLRRVLSKSEIGSDCEDLLSVERSAARGSSQAFKAFTKSNYRHNLQVLTGKSGVGMDAHHIFPQAKKFQSYFQRAGINIHDPKNLTWWKSGPHRSAANAYNNTWSEFFRATPNATRQQIESFGSSLMKSYGF